MLPCPLVCSKTKGKANCFLPYLLLHPRSCPIHHGALLFCSYHEPPERPNDLKPLAHEPNLGFWGPNRTKLVEHNPAKTRALKSDQSLQAMPRRIIPVGGLLCGYLHWPTRFVRCPGDSSKKFTCTSYLVQYISYTCNMICVMMCCDVYLSLSLSLFLAFCSNFILKIIPNPKSIPGPETGMKGYQRMSEGVSKAFSEGVSKDISKDININWFHVLSRSRILQDYQEAFQQQSQTGAVYMNMFLPSWGSGRFRCRRFWCRCRGGVSEGSGAVIWWGTMCFKAMNCQAVGDSAWVYFSGDEVNVRSRCRFWGACPYIYIYIYR